MTRRSSWFAVVLVLVLLFVTSDCLRRPTTHNEGRDLSTIRSRGNARFSSKAEEGFETTSEPLTTTSRSNHRSSNPAQQTSATLSRRRTNAFTKTEPTTERVNTGFSSNPVKSRSRNTFSSSNGDLTRAASGDRRYLPDSSSRKKLERVEEEVNLQTPHEFSKADRSQRGSPKSRNSRAEFQRRIDLVDPIDEVPSIAKSRNERKIQTTLSSRDFEDSGRYSSRRWSEGFSGSSGSTRDGTPRSVTRHFTERSIRKVDVDSSYSDQVNVGVPLASQSTTFPPRKIQESKLGQTRDILDKRNPDFTSRSSSRGVSKFAESAAYLELANNEAKQSTTLRTLSAHSYKKERLQLKNLQEIPTSRNRGKNLRQNDEISGNSKPEIGRGSFLEKKKLERSERVNEKPKVKTERRHFNLSDRYRPRKHSGLLSPPNESTRKPVSSSIDTTTAVPPTTVFPEGVTTVVFPSSPKKSTEASGYRRAAASTLTIKTLPKEEDLNDTLSFRGRKAVKQASYTTSITPSNQDNENFSNDIPTTNLPSNPRRGNKVFNKASIIKTDKEIVEESDNYPLEFKAKLAKVDDSGKSNGRPESPKFTKDDEVTKIITRHLRSTDQADPLDTLSETDETPGLKPILSESNISASPEGSKKRTPGVDFSIRSKQKLDEARKLVKPELKSEGKVDPDIGLSTTITPVKINEELKSLRTPKRYGTSKLSSTTSRAVVTATLPEIDKKFARTSKSVQRGSVRVGETTRIRQNRKERITTTGAPDDMFLQSTVAYSPQSISVEKTKVEIATARPLSSRNVDATTVRSSSTTRRSRPWNAAYIDKNWQEPTQRSSDNQNTSRTVVSKPPMRPRGYADRNRQVSTAVVKNDETTQKSVTFKVTKRPRAWNAANWQESTRKSDITTTQTSVTSRNTYSSLTTEKTVQTSRRRDSRPRTATYRRHLEVSQPGNSLPRNKEVSSVAITPKYHASIKTENLLQQSIKKDPAVSLELLNKTNANETFNSTGISTSSRGNSGNSDSNIFNPARATYLINSNASLLEQIRSTVAPLLSVLGAKTPAFAGVYRNVSSNETSAQRVTPSGSPPRFSARYRGVELFVRKPNDANSAGNTSTTPLTSSSDEASSPVSVSSLGDPKEVTFYRALESVSINNEVDQATDEERQQQLNRVAQVADSVIDKDSNISSNSNNDMTTETIATGINTVATTDSLTVVTDSQTLDTSTITQPDLTQTPEVNTSLPENMEMNQGPFDPQSVNNSSNDVTSTSSNTETVENSSTNVASTLSSTETTEISSTDAISMSSSTETNQVSTPEVSSASSSTIIIENSSTIPTSTDNSSIDVTFMPPSAEIIESSTLDQNSIMEMITTEVSTTSEPEVITSSTQDASLITESTTAERKELMNGPMEIIIASLDNSTTSNIENTAISVMPSSSMEAESFDTSASTLEMLSSTEFSTSSALTEEFEIHSQVATTVSMDQVTEDVQNITDSTIITTASVDFNNQTTMSIEMATQPASDSELNITTEEVVGESTTDSLDVIDDTLLNEMMMRLMDIVSENHNTSQLESNTVKNTSDDGAQLLGGFLDYTDRNSTLELELNEEGNESVGNTTPQNTTMENIIEYTPVSIDNIANLDNLSTAQSSNMTVGLESKELKTEIPDVEITTLPQSLNPEIISTPQDDLTNQVENMTLTPSTTEYPDPASPSDASLNIDDTNNTTNAIIELITTTLASETLEPTTVIEMLDSSITTPSDLTITTNPTTNTLAPETTLAKDDPNSLAGFQENTTATAQTTAGFQQATIQTTTEIPSSTSDTPSTTSDIPSTSSESPISTTEIPLSTSELPSTSEIPSSTTELPSSTPEMTISTPELTTTLPTTTESSSTSTSSSPSSTQTTTSASESTTMVSSTPEATTQSATQSTTASMTTFMQSTSSSTTPYMGRFGGSRMTPAPRLSSSSSTRMPLRDYHVYGIYPNKTIVRKRPEDNLIDARNVDSPYVIFGIYPDGKLVRKFPNGTVIPDPPTNPVEVVFSLSTSTTTNRPRPILQYNQANQGTNNQNIATFNNRPTGSIFAQSSGQADGFRSQLDLGLSDNALSPDGDGPNQFGDPTLMPGIGTVGTQLSSTNMITDASPGGSRPPSGVTPSSVNPQGGRIIQDIERDKASRTKEAGGQRSTVYIGQEKFINYWTNDTAQNDSRVVSVEINSVASAINEGSPGSSLPSLDILPNNQVQGRVTAPPGFPWKDSLDQIFGITTESPIIRASVASNTLDEPSSSRSPITARPINRLLEVFTPLLNANQLARDTSITITNDAPVVSTTVGAYTTTPTTTTSTTTSTTNSKPMTTSFAPTMMTTTPLPTPTIAASTTNTMSASTTSLFTPIGIPSQTSFGTTFDDLAFLNTLLESDYRPNSISSTPKTLTEVERLLANKILSLALSRAGPTRSPKAIQPSNASPNSLDILPASFGHSSPPIIIDLLQSTSKKPVAATTTTEPFTWKPVTDVTSTTSSKSTEITTKTTTTITSTTTTSTMTPPVSQVIFNTFPTHPPTTKSCNLAAILNTVPSTTATIPTVSFTTTTTPKPTTRKLVTARPALQHSTTTTQAPLGFGANFIQAIFGRNIFAPPTTTTRRPVKKVIQTTPRPVQTTPKLTSTTAAREMYAASEQIDHIDYSNLLVSGGKATSPQAATKYSPEDDAKFLLELLEASEKAKEGGKKESSVLSNDDEAFLRAILSGQAKVKLPQATTGDPASKNAVLLAELLKAQGIEPSTPPNRLREQLQGISVTSTTTIRPQIISTTSKRPTTSRPRPVVKVQSSTYPPPLFSNFNFGLGQPENSQQNPEGGVRNQVLTAAIGATRLFSQFLGAAITGAAQQLQSFVRNSTRYVSEAVG